MESSRRAVEAYKRTRLVDVVITDDDKVAPIYRLDEICDMLRTSSSDMVREVVEYTMKRLDGRSPRVKQKTLRMIKYAVVKGGPEFKRQMQRQAAAIRQLFEYKGQPDVLRGDALNKAVRDTAHEAVSAIFASDDKVSQTEEINKRIEGFGSTNYGMHAAATDVRKPSLTNVVSDVLEFGSASIKQGLTIISGYSGSNIGNMRNDTGSYRGPGLRKSLTSERGTLDRFDQDERGDLRGASESLGASLGSPVHNSRASQHDSTGARSDTDTNRARSLMEERLLDAITAPGGMRLQPTRESVQKFLASVMKLDQRNLCSALESKLQSPAWQIRFKALCVLEAIVRQRDQEFCGAVVDYFQEDAAAIRDCLQLPQTTLRDKAVKILDQLGASSKDVSEKNDEGQTEPSEVYEMPDLIDTGESDLLVDEKIVPHASTVGDNISSASVTTADLLGEGLWAGDAEAGGSSDVFAGLSFHTPDRGADDSSEGLFSGLSMNKPSTEGGAFNGLLNGLHEEKEVPGIVKQPASSDSLVDLLGSHTLNDSQIDASSVGLAENGHSFSQPSSIQMAHHGNAIPPQMFGNLSNAQMTYLNSTLLNAQMAQLNSTLLNPQMAQLNSTLLNPQMAQLNSTPSLPMGMFANYQAPMSIPHNFGGVAGNAFLQQQLPSGIAGLQGVNLGMSGMNGGSLQGFSGSGRVLGDGFDFSGDASSRFTAAADSGKKENTKAFDFISDHVSAARTPKKFF
eukprot:c22291_g1_i1 orf=233-2446(-)